MTRSSFFCAVRKEKIRALTENEGTMSAKDRIDLPQEPNVAVPLRKAVLHAATERFLSFYPASRPRPSPVRAKGADGGLSSDGKFSSYARARRTINPIYSGPDAEIPQFDKKRAKKTENFQKKSEKAGANR